MLLYLCVFIDWKHEGERGELIHDVSAEGFLGLGAVVVWRWKRRRRVWLTVTAFTGSREAGKGEVNLPHTVSRPRRRSPRGWN